MIVNAMVYAIGIPAVWSLYLVLFFLMGIPLLSIQIRRLRDAGQFWLWAFVPLLNVILLCFPTVDDSKPRKSVAGIIVMASGVICYFAAFFIVGNYGYNVDENESTALMIIALGLVLHIITLVSYVSGKNWSLIMSIVNLSFLNLATVYQMYLSLQFRGWTVVSNVELGLLYLFMVYVSLIAAIDNAMCLSNAKVIRDKVFWMSINKVPNERDNSLFRVGCAVASVVMGLSLSMPFFSINIQNISASYSFINVISGVEELWGGNVGDVTVPLVGALILLVLYIVVLFFASFAKSKAIKTTLGITVAISIIFLVFGTQTLFFDTIEGFFAPMRSPLTDSLGLVELIANSIGNIFTSIVRLEIGAWVLIGALAAYIIFASCQFSRIRKPEIGQLSFPQATQVVKVRCIECDSINDENAAFCNACGSPMRSKK